MRERWGDTAIQDYVATKDVVILATTEPDGTPLLTPMWFWHDEEAIVMVRPAGTRKARNITRDPRVTVLAESGTRGDIKRVIVTGCAEIVPDGAERARLVDRLLAKYHPLIEGIWGSRQVPPDRVVLRIVPRTVRSAGLGAVSTRGGFHDD
jgi:PPOX class probable F420-dependent enzyme